MPPTWITVIAWVALAAAVVTAGAILYDMYGRGHRQQMRVMEAVWPVTALYLGPLAWWAYRRWGGLDRAKGEHEPRAAANGDEPITVAVSVSHCGAGCTLGDIIGALLVFITGWKILGLALPAEYLADFALAFALGIAFQYFAIVPMRGLGPRDGVVAALKADTLSLTSFEIGMFGWMALMQLVVFTAPHLTPDHAAYWLLMQIGMVVGFATAYPVNTWLIRRGVKEAM
jgi:Domain of unknown function (DUF4396)